MDSKQFKEARRKLGLSVAELGLILDTEPGTIRRWEADPGAARARAPNPVAARVMKWMVSGFRPQEFSGLRDFPPVVSYIPEYTMGFGLECEGEEQTVIHRNWYPRFVAVMVGRDGGKLEPFFDVIAVDEEEQLEIVHWIDQPHDQAHKDKVLTAAASFAEIQRQDAFAEELDRGDD